MWNEKNDRNRQLHRSAATEAIDASLRIKAIGGRKVETNSGEVKLTSVLPERLKFRTTLRLPPEADWTVSLTFAIEAIPLEAIGHVRHAFHDRPWWTYEVELANPVTRVLLARLLKHRLKTRSPLLYSIHELYRRHNRL